MRIHVESIGVLAPGLAGWDDTRLAATGERPVVPAPFTPPTPACLPPAERRRIGVTARLALAAAEQALQHSACRVADMAMVFAAAEAAGEITHQLCEVLAATREVSPTVFHNSVHNAPHGYLSIATGARRSGTSLCRGRWTFATALLHAALDAGADAGPVLFVCYDSPMPPPLRAAMPVSEATAIALVLTPERTERTLTSLELQLLERSAPEPWPEWIPAAWHANASARGFPVLGAWAVPGAGPVRIPYSPELDLEVRTDG